MTATPPDAPADDPSAPGAPSAPPSDRRPPGPGPTGGRPSGPATGSTPRPRPSGPERPAAPTGRTPTATGRPPGTGRPAPAARPGGPGPGGAGTARPTAGPAPAGPEAPADPRRVLGYRRQRFEARKVRRLIRHIDPWSMLKLSVMVALCMWLITMIAAVILWTVATNAGTVSSIEDFVNSTFQLQDWQLDGQFLFRQFGLVALLAYLGLAASLVVASLVFNLISDIIGGVWVSVIEEESARPVGGPPRR